MALTPGFSLGVAAVLEFGCVLATGGFLRLTGGLGGV
jgi:hypothetical protein